MKAIVLIISLPALYVLLNHHEAGPLFGPVIFLSYQLFLAYVPYFGFIPFPTAGHVPTCTFHLGPLCPCQARASSEWEAPLPSDLSA